MEGEREEAGAARLGWAGTGGKRKWERHSESFSWCMGGGGGGGMRKLAWHFWDGTLCYRGESSHDRPPHIILILKMQAVMPTGSPMPSAVH